MTEGLGASTLQEAFDAAAAELGMATPSDDDTAQPVVDSDAAPTNEPVPDGTSEQPAGSEGAPFDDAAVELAESLMVDGEETQDGSEPGIVPGSDEFWNLEIEVNTPEGPKAVSINDLSDGFLRQADYTRKTQALAEQRKQLEKAEEFYQSFAADPGGFAYSLAVQAGLLDEGSSPAPTVPSAKIPTPDEIQAQVEELVKSRIEEDPRVVSAQKIEAQAQIDTEFDRLEQVFKIPISVKLRDSLIQEAIKVGSSDLEGILAKRLYVAREKQSRAGSASQAATSRPGVAPAGANAEQDANKPPETVREAWQQAKVAAVQQ